MSKSRKLIAAGAVLAFAVPVLALAVSEQSEFIAGGALINLGYRLQDHLHHYDFQHAEDISPQQIWDELSRQNELAAAVRERFPRADHHPVVAMVVCMDARIDTNELVGDTRKYYYVIRTAGSVISEREQEMLELAVANGVKVVVLTTHTDCAAERVAADAQKRLQFPSLSAAVDEREARVQQFLARPAISQAVSQGKLLVKRLVVDTATERVQEK